MTELVRNAGYLSPGAAMENHNSVKMDSIPGVCYMKFGVDGHSHANSIFPEERRLDF